MSMEYYFGELEEKYFYCNFECYMSASVLVELLLDVFIVVGYEIFHAPIDLIGFCAILSAAPMVYMLFCIYRSYMRGKVKLEIKNILIYRLYLLSPYRINKKQVIGVNIRARKRKTIIRIRTAKRKHTVKIYNV